MRILLLTLAALVVFATGALAAGSDTIITGDSVRLMADDGRVGLTLGPDGFIAENAAFVPRIDGILDLGTLGPPWQRWRNIHVAGKVDGVDISRFAAWCKRHCEVK